MTLFYQYIRWLFAAHHSGDNSIFLMDFEWSRVRAHTPHLTVPVRNSTFVRRARSSLKLILEFQFASYLAGWYRTTQRHIMRRQTLCLSRSKRPLLLHSLLLILLELLFFLWFSVVVVVSFGSVFGRRQLTRADELKCCYSAVVDLVDWRRRPKNFKMPFHWLELNMKIVEESLRIYVCVMMVDRDLWPLNFIAIIQIYARPFGRVLTDRRVVFKSAKNGNI